MIKIMFLFFFLSLPKKKKEKKDYVSFICKSVTSFRACLILFLEVSESALREGDENRGGKVEPV